MPSTYHPSPNLIDGFLWKICWKKFHPFWYLLPSERDKALKLRRSSSPSRSQGLSRANSHCKFLIVCNQKKKNTRAHTHLSPRKEKEYKDEEDEETYASAVVLVVPVGVTSSRVSCVCGVIPVKETAAVGVRTAADSR